LFLDNTKNLSAIQGDNIRLFRQDGALPVVNPTTGGGGLSFYSTGVIYSISAGSGLSPSEQAKLASIPSNPLLATDSKLTNLNLIPALL
jgi:hypothetical protein